MDLFLLAGKPGHIGLRGILQYFNFREAIDGLQLLAVWNITDLEKTGMLHWVNFPNAELNLSSSITVNRISNY